MGRASSSIDTLVSPSYEEKLVNEICGSRFVWSTNLVIEVDLAHWGLLSQKQTKQLKQIKIYNRSELGVNGLDLVQEIQVRWTCLVILLDELPYDAPYTNIMSVYL